MIHDKLRDVIGDILHQCLQNWHYLHYFSFLDIIHQLLQQQSRYYKYWKKNHSCGNNNLWWWLAEQLLLLATCWITLHFGGLSNCKYNVHGLHSTYYCCCVPVTNCSNSGLPCWPSSSPSPSAGSSMKLAAKYENLNHSVDLVLVLLLKSGCTLYKHSNKCQTVSLVGPKNHFFQNSSQRVDFQETESKQSFKHRVCPSHFTSWHTTDCHTTLMS